MSKTSFSYSKISIWSAILILSIAVIACSGAGATPPSQQSAATNVSPAFTSSPTQQAVATSQPQEISPAIPESRRLTLEYPPKMRAGVESEIITLKLEVDDFGNVTPTASINGNVVTGDVIQIPNLYATHNVTAEAQLDLAGMTVSPSGATFEPLSPGQPVTFYWSIRPQETGTYRGTVWLHLNFTDKSTGEQSRIAVSAQIIEIEAVDFFGLSAGVVRTSGVVGSIVGGLIGFPFLEDIVKYIFKKRKKE
ncbi:MAG: hypothetical protein U0Z26_03555 [Anaerolineales bacterium]